MAVQAMAAKLQADSDHTRFRVIATLRQAMNAAVAEGLLAQNPTRGVKNAMPRSREVQPFTVAEVDAIVHELGPIDGAAARLAVELGLRPEELFGLQRDDFSRDQNTVTLRRVAVKGQLHPRGKTRNSVPRIVPMTPDAWAALDSVPTRIDTPLVFTSPRGHVVRLSNWRTESWYPALEAAGLAQRGPYALRHTYATQMIAARVLDTITLARIMGTSVTQLERTYVHHDADRAQDAAAALTAWRDQQRREAIR
jgi:integrase